LAERKDLHGQPEKKPENEKSEDRMAFAFSDAALTRRERSLA